MKLKHPFPSQKTHKTFKKPGFALIATLTLMMLLAMLAVGLMALVSSQNRIALQTILQAEARQQALVGLDVAIGELQMELGADRRVSANSGIIDDSANTPQYILGVWDSWGGPIYGSDKLGKSHGKIQTTYSTGRKNMFRRWMISTRNEKQAREFESVNDLGKRRPGQRICMVGEGTLGAKLTQQHYVYADMIDMPAAGAKNKTSFAWWIGGENQKAKISVENPKEPENTMQMLHRTWDTPAPMIVNNDNLDYLPETIENSAKISTMASITLLGSSSQDAGMPYFHDITTTSYSLPINVRTGGFKQDLNLLLNKKTLDGTEFAPRQSQDCPIVEGDDVPKGTEENMPIGSWQNLFAYYNCWPNGEANDNDNITARMLGNVNSAYTRISGTAYDLNSLDYFNNATGSSGQNKTSLYDTRALMDRGNKYAGYARTPVMLAFMTTFCQVAYPNPDKQENTLLDVTYSPVFLWWNPYNVPMRIRGRQLWSNTLPYRYMPLYYKNYPNEDWRHIGKNSYAYNKEGHKYGDEMGEFFQNSSGDTTGDIIFQPGEIIIFSPNHKIRNAGYRKNPFVVGYDPEGISVHSMTFFNVPSGQAGNYYLDLRMRRSGEGYEANPSRPDGFWYGPDLPESFTMTNGYFGMGANPNAYSSDFYGRSPQSFLLGWYNPSNVNTNELIFCSNNEDDTAWPPVSSTSNPTIQHAAAFGIVAKSANPSVCERISKGDFRGKIWQHSSPALWGSMITAPCNQERQYHPYQLAALPVSDSMGSGAIDNIGRNGMLGINSEGEQVSFAAVMELPVHPPFSLAGFAGMRLTPGWYRAGGSGDTAAVSEQRRARYQAGVPGVGIGNAFADPCLPAGDVYAFHNTKTAKGDHGNLSANKHIYGDFFDHGLLINDALWDRWFCSSVSDMPSGNGSETIPAKDTLSKFITGQESLPISRYKKTTTPYSDEQIIQRIMDEDGWKHIAQYLMIDGGFNVNSTSVEAWAAVLQGLANRRLVTNKNSQLREVEEGKSRNQVLFSRFMLSTTDKSLDSLGGYSVMQGSSALRNSSVAAAWGEVRKLEPESIRRLAEEMVKQVRKRGPFLNMSDFINRRLDPAGGELALKGALQAAIDATDINRDFNEVTVRPQSGELYSFPEAENGPMHTAAPGYLIQSDILASLGNILTVRDDTFTVRAYGCVRNAQDAVLAQAWCEAVVQRTMDYVDPANNPGDAEYKPDGTKGTGLSEANKLMGRQFRIVSFKWLDHWDI